jgi:hypothetical protein
MVKGIFLWIALFAWALAILCWGLLSMFFPRSLRRIMEWYTWAERWSTRKPATQVQASLSQAVAGFFAVLIGGWMAFRLVAGLLRSHVGTAAPAQAVPRVTAGHHWSALVGGIAIIAFGVYGTLKPQISLRLTEANFPNRELSKDAVRRALQGGRVLGVLTILFGAFLLFLWYRWTH